MRVRDGRVVFLRGLLAGLASGRRTIKYNDMRRLCGLNKQQVGAYLKAVRAMGKKNEPDLSALVVSGNTGMPTRDWGDLKQWPAEKKRVFAYWTDRRRLNKDSFVSKHAVLPANG
jgi:hypothetical protein